MVSKPYVDDGYDRIVDSGDRLSRIQIKGSACASSRGPYRWQCQRNNRSSAARYSYTKNHIDFFAFIACDIMSIWIVPVGAVTYSPFEMTPGKLVSQRYENNWELLRRSTVD